MYFNQFLTSFTYGHSLAYIPAVRIFYNPQHAPTCILQSHGEWNIERRGDRLGREAGAHWISDANDNPQPCVLDHHLDNDSKAKEETPRI